MKYLLIILACLIGCSGPTPVLGPPKFSKGDVVTVNYSGTTPTNGATVDAPTLGIVRSVQQGETKWQYTVMFQNGDMNYYEGDLTLYRYAIWHPSRVHPEITADPVYP